MPKRKDINTILVIGAGPIVIGQGCEFDYSGTQAIKALKEEGYRVVLINSNPATIMTDPQFSDTVTCSLSDAFGEIRGDFPLAVVSPRRVICLQDAYGNGRSSVTLTSLTSS